MSNKNNARRTAVEVAFDGADITKSIRPYLKSMTYVDNEEDETDELQIQVHDRDSIWLEKWLTDAIEAASAAKLKMDAVIVRENWTGGGSDAVLPCGEFELDSVAASGPPAVINIKGPSVPRCARPRSPRRGKTIPSPVSPMRLPGPTAWSVCTNRRQTPFTPV